MTEDCQHSKIKALRKAKELTLREAGALFGVTERTFFRWETGDRPFKDHEFVGIVKKLEEYNAE